MTRITDNLREDQYMLYMVSGSLLLRMRNDSDRICRETKIHILRSRTPPSENRGVYEIIMKVEPGRTEMTVWRIRFACWIPKDTNTHSRYVILIDFPLQLRLH